MLAQIKLLDAKPIATAPRDGTRILVWDGDVWRPVNWNGAFGGSWHCCATGHNGVADYATHWMPMPEPPPPVVWRPDPVTGQLRPE